MLEIRQVLTMNSEEREKVKAEHPLIAERVGLAWNNGKICGQCKHFNQLGGRNGQIKHTGLKGTCSMVQFQCELVKPERVACGKFERVKFDD